MIFEGHCLVTCRISRHARAKCFSLARGRALPASDAVAPGAAVTAEPVGEAAAGEANDLGGDAAVAVARLADDLRLTGAEMADRPRRAGRAGRGSFRAVGRPWGHVAISSCPRRTRLFAQSSRRSSRPPHLLSPRLVARGGRLGSNCGPLPHWGRGICEYQLEVGQVVLIQFTVADGSSCPLPGLGHVGGAVMACTGTVMMRSGSQTGKG